MTSNTLHTPTLMSGQILLSFIFACVFFAAYRFYPRLRGTLYFAGTYLLFTLARLTFAVDGFRNAPDLGGIGDDLITVATLLQLLGLLQYFDEDDPALTRRAWIVAALLCPFPILSTFDQRYSVLGWTLYGACLLWLRLLEARLLLRHADQGPMVRIFGLFMMAFAVYAPNQLLRGLLRRNGILTLFHVVPMETFFLVINVFYASVIGFFLIFLLVQALLRDLENESRTDPLTGTLNRRGLFLQLEQELERAARIDRPVTIALMDIDHFKRINDTWGHALGDQALRHVTATIAGCIRPYDQLGRQGGDELALLMPECDPEQAEALAERVRLAVFETPLRDGIGVSLSIGLTRSCPADTPEAAFQRADLALYEAKRAGRNCIRSLDPPESLRPRPLRFPGNPGDTRIFSSALTACGLATRLKSSGDE